MKGKQPKKFEMSRFFDEDEWKEIIKQPDWYGDFVNFRRKVGDVTVEEADNLKGEVQNFFQENYLAGNINLAKEGPDWDSEREEVDTVVIHHTSGRPGMTWQTISTIHLLNVYAAFYANPYSDEEAVKGQPIYSGHFRDGIPVFYGYHFIVRNDGSLERMLEDSQIGWHAGNWDINKRSVAIVFDDDLEDKMPSETAIESVAGLIREKYPKISKDRIFGHKEVKKRGATTCPGNFFLPSKKYSGWKEDILSLI